MMCLPAMARLLRTKLTVFSGTKHEVPSPALDVTNHWCFHGLYKIYQDAMLLNNIMVMTRLVTVKR